MKRKGFTLIELVVVMAIIAILSLLVVGAIIVARNTATETANRSNAKVVQTALEAKFASNRTYPIIGTSAAPVALNSTTAMTPLGLTTASFSTAACAANAGGVMYSTASQYNIKVNTAACGTTYNPADEINGP